MNIHLFNSNNLCKKKEEKLQYEDVSYALFLNVYNMQQFHKMKLWFSTGNAKSIHPDRDGSTDGLQSFCTSYFVLLCTSTEKTIPALVHLYRALSA